MLTKTKLLFQITAVLILVVLVFNLSVQTADAFFAGLAFEINPAVFINLILQQGKEYIGDSVAWLTIGTIISTLGPTLVQWVATGDFGDPFFVRNWRGLLLNAADVALDEFDFYLQDEGLPSVCAPFRDFLKVQIGSPRIGGRNPYGEQYRQRFTCVNTFLNNIQNFENFVTNFDSGGWVAFHNLSSRNGNPFSLALTGLAASEQHIQRLTQARQNEAVSGRGFLSKTNKLTQKIQAPGNRVAEALTKSDNVSWDRLVAADEINELIGSLISAAITRVVKELAK